MKRILIIEDDINIAELERDYLLLHNYEVDIESTGDKGLKRALEGNYDLIILDLMLPGIDGFEICRTLRTKLDIPILMVSAKKEDIEKIRGLGLGADDYIIKPFSPSELVARVNAHLARFERLSGGGQKKEEIRIRGLLIDKASRRVFVNDKEVPFTTKEFDLLTFLASNPNRVFSKDQLFEQIWGMDSLGDIATVTVHIRKIREKIELDPSNSQYIDTIWGAGYRFKV
ncbi:response regulator transcription factor [Cohnella pontilimi]|uniref:Response regulator transcription factor n=1 Tax=Cohnella pontilimi TaxID=2564100 RepID=A0A4U0FD83_9BACL|nr:response regulator transcription factor [Cohnella pontilimi]TJY42214.1 response regulator transcription factor [Cohnella pontilimi]